MTVSNVTTAPRPRVFIQCDWINVEGRLTAHFSKDPTLQSRLDDELRGGPKVHSLNAAAIYGASHGVTPANAKEVYVTLQGRQVPAYDGGKRITHLWNYGGEEDMISQQFWITPVEARRHCDTLRSTYPRVPAWRQEMADEVFGVARNSCPRCGATSPSAGTCDACSRPGRPVNLRWDGWAIEPSREMRTPFGRRRMYLGRRGDGMKPLAAQLPQSSGASMWYRTLCRLHGFDVAIDGTISPWPVPVGALTWWPGATYSRLVDVDDVTITIVTGTYDSFLTQAPQERVDEVAAWMLWTMEQAWPQLGGRRFPADVAVGHNWAPVDMRCRACGHGQRDHEHPSWCSAVDCLCVGYMPRHTTGLREVKYHPLTATAPMSLVLPFSSATTTFA